MMREPDKSGAVGLRGRAYAQFERRSPTYQDSFAQKVYCKPTTRMLLQRVARLAPRRVLDVGCGTGQLLLDLRRCCPQARLVGLDLCPGMIDRARRLLGDQAELTVGDSQHLPFADRTFDLVVCTHSFHHYPDQQAVLGEMYRVLEPGGAAVVLDGNPEPWWGWLLYDVFVVWAEGPVRHRRPAEMACLFRRAGFRDVRQYTACPWSPVLMTLGVTGKDYGTC